MNATNYVGTEKNGHYGSFTASTSNRCEADIFMEIPDFFPKNKN